ncbi:MAG: transporter [Sutterella sp.]|nr:transporter [Sutterella sp.]
MLTEQSAGAMGRAYAGVGVDGLDISGTYYNPATMALHQGTKMQAGFVHIGVNAEYSGNSGATENGRLKSQSIPHGYITHQINDGMWVGLAMTVPWGMGTQYDNNWEGAGRGTETKMRSFDFNPNLAWKLTDNFIVGAGVSIQYVAATLKVSNVEPVKIDAEYKADSIDWGFNLGAMWCPTEDLRFGLSYRSEIEHHTEGHMTLRPGNERTVGAIAAGMIPAQMFRSYDAELIVSGPAWAMATAAWDINDALSLYGTFRWTDWSSFTELNITYGGQVKTLQNQWKDAYLGSVGADYRLNDEWTIRAGIGYETTPISNPRNRTAVIPDVDRWWFAVGSSYKPMKNLQADVSLALLHGVHERNLYAGESSDSAKIGKYDKLDAYLFGFQLVYAF